jgi:Protein of unknown function (DUF4239)
MSDLLIPLLVVIGAALVGALAVVIKHFIFPPKPDAGPREKEGVADFIAMMVGVLYALVLGMALVAVWEVRDNADTAVQTEASSLNQVYVLANSMPAPSKQQIQAAVTNYAHFVVTTEWPEMAAHQDLSQTGWQDLDAVMSAVDTFQPATPLQANISSQAISELSSVYDARRDRETDASEGLSPVLWAGLIIGAVLTGAFVFLYGVQRRGTHLVMVMALTALIGFQMMLIFGLDHPFSGSMGVDSDVFTRFLGT